MTYSYSIADGVRLEEAPTAGLNTVDVYTNEGGTETFFARAPAPRTQAELEDIIVSCFLFYKNPNRICFHPDDLRAYMVSTKKDGVQVTLP